MITSRMAKSTSRHPADVFCNGPADVGCFLRMRPPQPGDSWTRPKQEGEERALDGVLPSTLRRNMLAADQAWSWIDFHALPDLHAQHAQRAQHAHAHTQAKEEHASPDGIVMVKEVVHVALSNQYGLGDSLNGLVTAYWIAWALDARLIVCWPPGSQGFGELPIRPAHHCSQQHAAHAAELNKEYALRGYDAGYKVNSAQRFVMRGANFSFVSSDSILQVDRKVWYQAHCQDDFWRLRSRPRLYLSTNRGIMVRAFYDMDDSRLGAYLRRTYASPFDAAGAALRAILQLRPRQPVACLHIRSALTFAGIDDLMGCVLEREQMFPAAGAALGIRIFSDIGTGHLRYDRSDRRSDGSPSFSSLSPFAASRYPWAAANATANTTRASHLRAARKTNELLQHVRGLPTMTNGSVHLFVRAVAQSQRVQAASRQEAKRRAKNKSRETLPAADRQRSSDKISSNAPTAATAWLELASCSCFYIPSSTFSLSAAAASGSESVFAAPHRYITPFATCDEVFVPKQHWKASPKLGLLHAGAVFP